MNIPKWKRGFGLLVAMMLIVAMSAEKSSARTLAQNDRETIKSILTMFESNPQDRKIVQKIDHALEKLPQSSKPLLYLMKSLQGFSSSDTFSLANKIASDALDAASKCRKKEETRKTFEINPSIEYFSLMNPSEAQMRAFEKRRYLVLPFARLLYRHCELFYRIGLRKMMFEAASCFQAICREYYSKIPEVKKMDRQIKLWSNRLNKDVPHD